MQCVGGRAYRGSQEVKDGGEELMQGRGRVLPPGLLLMACLGCLFKESWLACLGMVLLTVGLARPQGSPINKVPSTYAYEVSSSQVTFSNLT